MPRARVSPYLAVWTVISLRPAAQQAAMKRAIVARGATPLALPALRLAPMADVAAARRALRAALACPLVVFTSPAAVRHAARLLPLRARRGQRFHAIGSGSARALARQGVPAQHPGHSAMHSEGLLARPEFAALAPGTAVGLVTAPGGRGLLAQGLLARGARLQLAEVYRRLPPRFDRRHHAALLASRAPRALLLSSAEALENALAGLPPDAVARLRASLVVASSPRLAQLARRRGFARVLEATGPTPEALLDALEARARRRRG
jgi:uroporphyrinogen-III synthase